jgi:hypothetical protein
MEEDTCFVITGLLQDNYVDYLISLFSNIKEKIVSTWKDQDINLINRLINNGFILVLNDYPEIKISSNFQIVNNYNGAKRAKELGYKYTLNIRTDLIPNDTNKFRTVLRNLIDKKLSSLGFFGHDGGYILHHFICGPVDKILEYFCEKENELFTLCYEKYLQQNYFKKENVTFQDTLNEFKYCIQELKDNNINFYWIKYPQHPEIVEHFYNIEKNYPQHYIKY